MKSKCNQFVRLQKWLRLSLCPLWNTCYYTVQCEIVFPNISVFWRCFVVFVFLFNAYQRKNLPSYFKCRCLYDNPTTNFTAIDCNLPTKQYRFSATWQASFIKSRTALYIDGSNPYGYYPTYFSVGVDNTTENYVVVTGYDSIPIKTKTPLNFRSSSTYLRKPSFYDTCTSSLCSNNKSITFDCSNIAYDTYPNGTRIMFPKPPRTQCIGILKW
jgi:hypothetical protein